MYERAASPDRDAGALLPIWYVDARRALFVGPLGYNAPHAHSVPVYLAGLYEPFRLRINGGPWRHCRTAAIPAGVSYEFDVAGQPLAVFYLEPSEAGVEALVPLVGEADEADGARCGQGGAFSLFRDLYESPDGGGDAGAALDSVLAYSKACGRRAFDARIAVAVALLSDPDRALPVGEAARLAGLSPSRFQHLFAREVGVPFRRFRSWQRLRHAISGIASGASFTAAAHDAGFFDQAHFARTFRQTFGAPASPSLRRVRRG
ncbi:helix-turn-helix domain-containing protein [Hyphomicrobium sp. CS1GBMeth3]|uniref:helix-turn-helix domain-containing protein n=1 Tax=Hyphomicrobium sp. CS1GBMeth3 TaxID=1892845 RepID=UPI000A663A41|nr:helix-turn-helix domain-containing protein [Hyphomicrobium sp. CS1GBMeth3]